MKKNQAKAKRQTLVQLLQGFVAPSSNHRSKNRRQRMQCERLEARQMMAGDTTTAALDQPQDLFGSPTVLASGVSRAQAVAAGDFDGDGQVEAIIGGSGLRLIDSDGSQSSIGNNGSLVFEIVPVDMDADGDLDFVAAQSSRVSWFENNGQASFVERTLGQGGAIYGVGVGDVDGDGDLDIAHTSADAVFPKLYWHENVGSSHSPSFANQMIVRNLERDADPWDVQIEDLDGDGREEIIMAAHRISFRTVSHISSYSSRPSGGFELENIGRANFATRLEVADLQGNGSNDVVSSAFGWFSNPLVHQWKNDGTGEFDSANAALGTERSFDVAVGDIDLDGDIDLAYGEFSATGKIHWLENDGAGDFTDHTLPGSYRDVRELAIADLTNDGKPDIIVTLRDAGEVIIFENQSSVTPDPDPDPDNSDSIPIGNVHRGVAASDTRTGTGYLMYSQQTLAQRFGASWTDLAAVAEHVVPVVYQDGPWYYDNNEILVAFTPGSSDVLLARIDFSRDTVSSLEGQSAMVSGIQLGFASGDLVFEANRFGNSVNRGEFSIRGTEFELNASVPNQEGVFVGSVNGGVAASDTRSGQGYLMFSAQPLAERFGSDWTDLSSVAEHFVPVVYQGGRWFYDDNETLREFTATANDVLVATIDFSLDTIVSLEGQRSVFGGIQSGYVSGNLTFEANRFGGRANRGEFFVNGTHFVPNENVSVNPNEVQVGLLNRGIAASDTRTGTGFLMYSQETLADRFGADWTDLGSIATNIVAVVPINGVWFYDNNETLVEFSIEPTDVLLASIDFSRDTIISLEGQKSVIAGIQLGYQSGDLQFHANQFAGRINRGEFMVAGNSFVRNERVVSAYDVSVGVINRGIAASDTRTGLGYLLHSTESLPSRFGEGWTDIGSVADHLVAVVHQNGVWYYDDNETLRAFTPASTDVLIATIDFGSDQISSLEGQTGVVGQIQLGYARGDLQFIANRFGSGSNRGEFSVSGTGFDRNEIAQSLTGSFGLPYDSRYRGLPRQVPVQSHVVAIESTGPSTATMTISTSRRNFDFDVRVLNGAGTLLRTFEVSQDGTLLFNLGSLSSGSYTIELDGGLVISPVTPNTSKLVDYEITIS
ncbi:MAG: FG-GAP repeat domain-containing protein [Rubripirellula sp.]